MKMMEQGANGDDVLALQNLLVCLKDFPAGVVPNGNFGPSTIAGVKAFQQAQGIAPTGGVGSATLKAINTFSQ
jgi:peptidoglycan hydrolase-like protein with peptidoglycan-binding domain